MNEMKDDLVTLDRLGEGKGVAKIPQERVDPLELTRKQELTTERSHASARGHKPTAKVRAEEAAGAEHDAGGSARHHGVASLRSESIRGASRRPVVTGPAGLAPHDPSSTRLRLPGQARGVGRGDPVPCPASGERQEPFEGVQDRAVDGDWLDRIIVPA